MEAWVDILAAAVVPWDEMAEGARASFAFRVSADDMRDFVRLSDDRNPLQTALRIVELMGP